MHRLAWVAAAVVLAHAALGTGPAAAQEAERDAEARGLFLAGQAAFDSGRFEDALRYFQQSYALSPRPGLLFNIGQAADRARVDDIALDAFRRYLASEAAIAEEDRRSLELRVRALEAAAARSARAEAAEPDEPAAPVPDGALAEPPADAAAATVALPPPAAETLAAETPARGDDGAALGLLVAGGVVIAGGAVLAGVGAPDTGALASPRDGETYPQAQSRQDTGTALVASGLAGLGLGAVLAAIGGALLAESPEAAAHVRLSPSGLEVTF
jgi:hypothetical protein